MSRAWCCNALPGDTALPARGETFRAKKISPVIAGNLQTNHDLSEIITGNNRSLFSALRRLFDGRCAVTRERARTGAIVRRRRRARANHATGSPSVFRRVPMPARLTSMRKLHRGKSPNMETKYSARNCRKCRFEKIFEQTSNLCREFPANILARQAVGKRRDFSELFLDPEIDQLRLRGQPRVVCRIVRPHELLHQSLGFGMIGIVMRQRRLHHTVSAPGFCGCRQLRS